MGKRKVQELEAPEPYARLLLEGDEQSLALAWKAAAVLEQQTTPPTKRRKGSLYLGLDELVCVLDSLELIRLLVRDGDAELFLDAVHKFVGVETVGTKILAGSSLRG